MALRLPKWTPVANSGRWRIRRRSLKHRVVSKGQLVHKPYMGLTNYETKTITISWGLTDNQILETLVHELVHAAIPDLEEHAVQRIEFTIIEGLKRLKDA